MSAAILHTDNQTVFLMTIMAARREAAPKFEFALGHSHEERCTAADTNPPNGPDSVFVRNQVARGADADAAPELNNALHPVFAMSERPGSVYAVFTASRLARLTYPCLRFRQAAWSNSCSGNVCKLCLVGWSSEWD